MALQGRDRQGRAAASGPSWPPRPTRTAGLVYAGFSLGGVDRADTSPSATTRRAGCCFCTAPRTSRENASVDELPVQLHVAEPGPVRAARLAERLVPADAAGGRRRGDLPVRRAPGTCTPTPTCPTTTRRRPRPPGGWRSASSRAVDPGGTPASGRVGGPCRSHRGRTSASHLLRAAEACGTSGPRTRSRRPSCVSDRT